MCGIAGCISWNQIDTNLSENIKHRGPDDFGVYTDGPVRLEHRRLSIIDTSSRGHQPMQTKDGNLVIIFNGEIYNYKDLKRDLLFKGYKFDSQSDTEVLLYGFAEYGTSLLAKLNGIFAFVIYNKQKKELVIARDQFGTKPLYYYYHRGIFLFSSEIKSFLSFPEFDRSINYGSILNYIQYLYSPGSETPFTHVKKLDPGHYMKLEIHDEIKLKLPVSYYNIPFSGKFETRSEDEWIDITESHLLKAVESQLLSDVPLGFFLSGGLDSSLLVAMAKTLRNGDSIPCFTIDSGKGMKREGFSSDLYYARKVAQTSGVKLNELKSTPNILGDFDKLIWHLDEPQADPAAIHVYNISRGARELDIKVLLSGAGGDDIFTGYRRHQALNIEPYLKRSPKLLLECIVAIAKNIRGSHPMLRRIKKVSGDLALSPESRMIGYFTWLSTAKALNLFKEDIHESIEIENVSTSYFKNLLEDIPLENNRINQMLYLELKTFLPSHNLNYTDKMSMAAGVEARVPYLDIDLVNLSTSMPPRLKMKGNTTKYILKRVGEKYLPKSVVYRPKTGFGAPVRGWVKHDLKEMINDRLSNETLKKRGFLCPKMVSNIIRNNSNNLEDNAYPILSLLAIESWFEQFVDVAIPKSLQRINQHE